MNPAMVFVLLVRDRYMIRIFFPAKRGCAFAPGCCALDQSGSTQMAIATTSDLTAALAIALTARL
jgi:hypothetical protein